MTEDHLSAHRVGATYRKAAGMKCRHCGKQVRLFEGKWYHYWRVRDADLVSVPAGARECGWRVRPGPVTYADPDD